MRFIGGRVNNIDNYVRRILRQNVKLNNFYKLPYSTPNMRIGLLGGSFNPAHEGHILISEQVRKRLNLDIVWWLFTPGNPLKNNDNLASLEERILYAENLIKSPNIRLTAFEARYGFIYSYDSLSYLLNRLADRRFVWIMGSDNFYNFHKWYRWRDIAKLLPMAIYARPGTNRRALFSKAAMNLRNFRLALGKEKLLFNSKAPSWIFLNGASSAQSSSKIRAKQK